MTAIVTKESLRKMLNEADDAKRQHIIGRALVRLFDRQTNSEQQSDSTEQDNGIGFAGGDAKGGSLTAKFYLKHGMLLDWQVERWTRVGKSGYPRICKYARQLDEVAQVQAAKKKMQMPLVV